MDLYINFLNILHSEVSVEHSADLYIFCVSEMFRTAYYHTAAVYSLYTVFIMPMFCIHKIHGCFPTFSKMSSTQNIALKCKE